MIYSVLETARANGRDVYRYMAVLLEALPNAQAVEEFVGHVPRTGLRWAVLAGDRRNSSDLRGGAAGLRNPHALILGESADEALVASMREIALREEPIRDVSRLLTMHFAPDQVLVNEAAFQAERGARHASDLSGRIGHRMLDSSSMNAHVVCLDGRSLQRLAPYRFI